MQLEGEYVGWTSHYAIESQIHMSSICSTVSSIPNLEGKVFIGRTDLCEEKGELGAAKRSNSIAIIFLDGMPISDLMAFPAIKLNQTVLLDDLMVDVCRNRCDCCNSQIPVIQYLSLGKVMNRMPVSLFEGSSEYWAGRWSLTGSIIFSIVFLASVIGAVGLASWKLHRFVDTYGWQFSLPQICLVLEILGSIRKI